MKEIAVCTNYGTCNGHGEWTLFGECECKGNYISQFCDQCAPKHYPYPSCPELDLVTIFGEHHGKCFNPKYEYFKSPPLML